MAVGPKDRRIQAEVAALYWSPQRPPIHEVAKRLGISKKRVQVALRLEGRGPRPAGVCGRTKPAGIYARNGGNALRASRREARLSQRELGRRSGVSQALISGLESEYGFAVGIPRASAIAAVLGRDLDELFTPARPAWTLFAQKTQATSEPLERWNVTAARAFAAQENLWTTRKAADYLAVTERTLLAYRARGYIAAAAHRWFGVLPFYFWDPSEVKKLARERCVALDGRVRRFYNSVAVYEQTLVRGLPADAAARAASRASRRHAKARQVIAGRSNGYRGGAAGIHPGRERGGRRPLMSPEQQVEIFRLHELGQPSRMIAKAVFGDESKKDRVLRFLRR